MSNLMLDVDQAGELKAAFRRSAWTNAKVKRLCEGDLLAQVLQVVDGLATITLPKILQQVATRTISAVTKFVTADHFKVDTSKTATVKLGYLGLSKELMDKVEENISAGEVAVHTLLKDSLDEPILKELGDRAETTLANLWELLTKQGHGRKGTLLTNDNWNIFYIRDTNGKLWAVSAIWDARYGDWSVCACSVGSPSRWLAGRRVFSRK